MTKPLSIRLSQELEQRSKDKLLRTVEVYKPCHLNLSSNDYLQLRTHPKVIEGAIHATREYGTSSGASPLLSGFMPCHDRLLKKLLEWKNKNAGMLFNTGFMANQAVLKHLPGKRDLVLADRLIHHSMAQALTQGRARFQRYDHLDLSHLEDLLIRHHGDYETIFVATESIFSMDGDHPDLHRLIELKSKRPFVLILDEAHATGIYGKSGGGLAEEMGILHEVDILIGTLGKSLASMGAYVLTNTPLITDYLTNFAGEFIYSTFLAPAQAGAAISAIDIIRESSDNREKLRATAKWFRTAVSDMGMKCNRNSDSPIIPVITGSITATMELKNHLLENGILVGAVRPPTIPEGTSRLRISLHSGATQKQLEEVLNILKLWKKR